MDAVQWVAIVYLFLSLVGNFVFFKTNPEASLLYTLIPSCLALTVCGRVLNWW